MKKRGIFLRFALLVLLVAAFAVAATGCAGKTKPDPDPAADDYDVKYVSTMPSGTDDGITIDGALNETVYAGQKTFVNYLSEDYDRTAEHFSMTTYVGEKGWYIVTEVTDSALVYNGLLASARNSTIHLYYLLASEGANAAIREIYMDAGRVYGRTPCNIGLMEYGVKVNGELNGATSGMTAELFIPWKAMGLTEKPENANLLMYPMYAIPKGGGDYRNLSPLPNLSGAAEQFYLFDGTGYADKDADDAILGDAKNGHVKAGVWTYTDVEKTEADGKVTLSGSVSVHASAYAKTYIKDIVAENYVVEATVKVTGRDYGKRDGRAGLTVDIAGGKRKTFAAYISAEENNAAGLNLVPLRSFYGDDYDGRNNRTTNLSSANLADGKTLSDGVKFTLIKSGANLYGLADGEIVLAETDNAIRGKCAFNLTAANVNAEFTDISYSVYDGDEEGMSAAIAGYGIRRITAETEGYGNVYLDKIAVKDGGDVTLTVECGEDNVIKEIKINGEAVTDFAEKAEIFGTTVRYVISNVTEDTNILVTFDEYAGVKVSGTISVVGESGLNMSDSVIYAFRADGSVIPFESRVNEDGTYEITLPAGTYDKIRVVGAGYANDFDKIGDENIVVGTADITGADFALETRVPTVVRHGEGSSVWTMTGNKEYTVSGMSHGNAWVEGNFGRVENFALSTRIIADKPAEAGVSLFGTHSGRNDYDVMIRITAGGKMGISLYGWAAGWASPDDETCKVGKTYNPNDFRLTVVRNGDTISVFVDDVLWKTYSGKITANLDFSNMGKMRAGLAVRGLTGVVFKDYTFTESQSEIDAIVSRVATVATLDEADGSAVIEGITGGRANIGAEVKFTVTPANGKFIRVLADGAAIAGKVNADGSAVYTYRMGADDVNFTYEVTSAYAVSGTIPEDLAGATVSVISDGTETVYNNATDGTDYSVVLPAGSYMIRFVAGNREGVIENVAVTDGALTDVNLASSAIKLETHKHGGGVGGGRGDWTIAGHNKYTVSPLGGNSYTLGLLGSGTDFVVTTRIKDGDGKEVGVGIDYDGCKNNLFVLKTSNSKLVQLYSWYGGWGSAFDVDWTGLDKNDFEYTVARKGDSIYVFLGGKFVGSWSGIAYGNKNIAEIGESKIGLYRRGPNDNDSGLVTFYDFDVSTDSAKIDEYLYATVTIGSTWNDADGTLAVGGIENGKAKFGSDITFTVTPAVGKTVAILANGTAISGAAGENGSTVYTHRVTGNVTFTYEIENVYAVSGSVPESLNGGSLKAVSAAGRSFSFPAAVAGGEFSVTLPDGTYDLTFVGDTTEGMIKGVVVNGAAVDNVNLDKAYIKPISAQKTHGGRAAGTNALTANGEYTVAAAANGNAANGIEFGARINDFVLTSRVSVESGKNAEVGATIDLGGDNFAMFRFYTKAQSVCIWGYAYGMTAEESGAASSSFDSTDFVYTLVRKGKTVYVIVDGTLRMKYSGSPAKVSNWGNGINLDNVGAGRIELGVRGVTGAKFSDYSFSTTDADVDAAITASVDAGVWNDADGTRTVTGVTDGKAKLGDSVEITVTPLENKIVKVFANGTALSGTVNGDSYVYTYKVNSIAKITFTYEVTSLYVVSGNVTADLSGATIKVTDTATGSATEYKNAVSADGDYSITLPDGAYTLYLSTDSYEGLIKNVVVNGAAVEANLDKAYTKPLSTQVAHGGTAQGTNTLTDNGEYTIVAATNGNSTNGLLFGKSVAGDFILTSKISVPTDMRTEVGVQIYSAATNILMFRFHTWNGGTSMYGWNSGTCGLDNAAGSGKTFDKTGFVYTLVRKNNSFYMFIDGTLWKTYSGSYATTDTTWGKGIDLASVGAVDVELAIRGTTTGNKFSAYSFSTDTADIDAALGVVEVAGTVADSANGTVTATAAVGGATYTASVVNGAYTIKVGKNSTYKLYFDCGDEEGLVSSVAVGETGVTAATATLAQKVKWIVTGNRTVTMSGTGSYTVSDNADGAYSFGLIGTASGSEESDGDFMVSTRILNGKGRHVGIALRYGESNGTFLSFIKAGGSSNVCAYNSTAWENPAKTVDWTNGNIDDYAYTVIKKGGEVKVYIDGKLIGTYTEATVGGTTYNIADLRAIDVQVGLALCWTKNDDVATAGTTSATFTDYTFSTDTTAIDEYITAHNA